ncbi:hypothetical protein SASPL_152615 [Salvia splendens]|uniref:Uncharacterized protein n=1 Tax=Salvia splendens TaxID=180675 RepID=A0A8X8W3K2_SALSN|nr:hypothetical protein SASPL_152615 [Salvia splendens]
MAIPPQSEFFYKGKWSPACDNALVDCLIMLKGEAFVEHRLPVMVPAYDMNSFAGAYFYQEEPIWARLACVFGFDDVKVVGQQEQEVVVISDYTEEIHEDDIIINALVDEEEEVNSPAVFPGPNVHRKLFDDDPVPND